MKHCVMNPQKMDLMVQIMQYMHKSNNALTTNRNIIVIAKAGILLRWIVNWIIAKNATVKPNYKNHKMYKIYI